jgi:hypothetical protein
MQLMVGHPCDRNLDGTVDAADLGMLLADSDVDGAAIGRLLGAWGERAAPTLVARSPSSHGWAAPAAASSSSTSRARTRCIADTDGWVFVTHRITLPAQHARVGAVAPAARARHSEGVLTHGPLHS